MKLETVANRNYLFLAALTLGGAHLNLDYNSQNPIIPDTQDQTSLNKYDDLISFYTGDYPNTYSRLSSEDHKLFCIRNFTKEAINDLEDLDEEFSNIVDEHFWDLI